MSFKGWIVPLVIRSAPALWCTTHSWCAGCCQWRPGGSVGYVGHEGLDVALTQRLHRAALLSGATHFTRSGVVVA